MSLSAEDYEQAFEDACASLPGERDPSAVRSQLLLLEWVLVEAINGALAAFCGALGLAIAIATALLIKPQFSAWIPFIVVVCGLGIGIALYELLQAYLRWEIGRKFKRRGFATGTSPRQSGRLSFE